jgi:hypothetical protein
MGHSSARLSLPYCLLPCAVPCLFSPGWARPSTVRIAELATVLFRPDSALKSFGPPLPEACPFGLPSPSLPWRFLLPDSPLSTVMVDLYH